MLKNNSPTIRVNTGVREFSIPAMALSILVSAFMNKKAGIKLPKNPATSRYFISLRLSLFRLLIEYGSKASDARDIRMQAACVLVKLRSPIFISMNELPQIRARNNNIPY
jgi:hypothetical protein